MSDQEMLETLRKENSELRARLAKQTLPGVEHECEIRYVAHCACGWQSTAHAQKALAVYEYQDHIRPYVEAEIRKYAKQPQAKPATTQSVFARTSNAPF